MDKKVFKIEYNTPDDWDEMVLVKGVELAGDTVKYLQNCGCFNIRVFQVEIIGDE